MHPPGVKANIGVIIGRFQIAALHQGHLDLITTVMAKHPKVVIFLGVASVQATKSNPLNFDARRLMIQERFPSIIVLPLPDCRTDEQWSENIDAQLRLIQAPMEKAVIYGSRDSCLPHYKGTTPTQIVEHTAGIIEMSGKQAREELAVRAQSSEAWRAGAIWAAHQHFPKVVTTVDVAVVDYTRDQVLLVRKPKETAWRILGGFSEPKTKSFEEDAKREVLEESGLALDYLQYLGSFNIPDWRMKFGDGDQIRTLLFAGRYVYGFPVASDDIEETKWVSFASILNIDGLACPKTVPEHADLFLALKDHLKTTMDQGNKIS